MALRVGGLFAVALGLGQEGCRGCAVVGDGDLLVAENGEQKPVLTAWWVDRILRYMPLLRAEVEFLEPRSSTSVVVLTRQNVQDPVSGVEKVAVRRAALSAVLDAVDRAIRSLHPEQRRVYRMRYRAGLTYKEIASRLHMSRETVGRRLFEVRIIVGNYLERVPPEDLKEFKAFVRARFLTQN